MQSVKINVSDFASAIGYCQHLVQNRYHLRLKPKESEFLRSGRLAHEMLEKQDKLMPRKQATPEELADPNFDLDFTREGITVCIERINQNIFRYVGRTDKIVRIKGTLLILDDKIVSKPRDTFYIDRLLQLSAYCEGFVRNYSRLVAYNSMAFMVIQRNSDLEILHETTRLYDIQARSFLMESFSLFESLYNKTVIPQHHENPRKCNACRYSDNCPSTLVGHLQGAQSQQ